MLPLIAALALGSCAGFGPVRDATRAQLPAAVQVQPVAGRFESTVETPVFAGVYDTVLAIEPLPGAQSPRVRLQWFPEIGGKFVDLDVDAAAIRGQIATGAPYACPLPIPAGTRPDLLLVLGLALRERFTPVTQDRATGERAGATGPELALDPATPGGTVSVVLDPDGTPRRWRLDYGWLAITIDAGGTLRARGTEIRFDWTDVVAVDGDG